MEITLPNIERIINEIANKNLELSIVAQHNEMF